MSVRPAFGSNVESTSSVSQETPKPSLRIGALWNRVSESTKEEFKTGEITFTPELLAALNKAENDKYGNKIVRVVVFSNNKKESANQPDYRIILGKERNI